MNPAEAALRAAPPLVPIWPLAGRALDIGRRKTYDLAAQGALADGIPVLKVGARLKVRRADLFRYLGLDDAPEARSA